MKPTPKLDRIARELRKAHIRAAGAIRPPWRATDEQGRDVWRKVARAAIRECAKGGEK